jgi:hypothetical protein
LSIDDYISQLELIINTLPITTSYSLIIDRKTAQTAFISGRIYLRDSSAFEFKEFIESSDTDIEKYKYAYNYHKGADNLFRYDNAPDPRARRLKTFPHHKHLRSGEIIESLDVTLADVLKEIERICSVT